MIDPQPACPSLSQASNNTKYPTHIAGDLCLAWFNIRLPFEVVITSELMINPKPLLSYSSSEFDLHMVYM